MRKQYSKQRFEIEEFDDENVHNKLRKSWAKKPTGSRCNPNWKRLWLDGMDQWERWESNEYLKNHR
jgi:hypothetical protein